MKQMFSVPIHNYDVLLKKSCLTLTSYVSFQRSTMNNSPDHTPDPKLGGPVPALPDIDVNHEPVKDLHYTRSIRGLIVKGIAGDGIPSDPKALGLLMATLKDMDSAALGQMRIKSEEKGQELQAQQQALVREYLSQAGGVRPPARQNTDAGAAPVAPPSLDDSVDTRDFVPGELQQGTVNQTFEEFSAARGGVELATNAIED